MSGLKGNAFVQSVMGNGTFEKIERALLFVSSNVHRGTKYTYI